MACTPDHDKHLCMMIAKRASLDELKKVAKDAKHICKNCGRASNDPKRICAPEEL